MKIFISILIMASVITASLFAESTAVTDEDEAMFSSSLSGTGSEEKAETPEAKTGKLVVDITDNQDSGIEYKGLEYENVRFGGKFDFTVADSWLWTEDPVSEIWNSPAAGGDLFNTNIDADIFFEARPDTDTKFFGKIGIKGPLYTIEDDPATPAFDESRSLGDIITIKELFADFNFNEDIFFRAGKQTINYGVGYFYSPADVLSLAEINPEDPTAELEGPVSVKMSIPIGLNNIQIFIVIDEASVSAADTALVPAVEFVAGNAEIGFGGYFRTSQDPRLFATLTTSVFGGESIFAEATAGYGSGSGLKLDGTDKIFTQLTGGLMFSDSVTDDNDFNIFTYSLAGQYLFNYGDSERSINITMPGDHYLTLMGSLSNIAETDISLSSTYQANLSDGSGRLYTTAIWKVFDGLRLNANALWITGDPGDEYTSVMPGIDGNDKVALTLSASLGSGIF